MLVWESEGLSSSLSTAANTIWVGRDLFHSRRIYLRVSGTGVTWVHHLLIWSRSYMLLEQEHFTALSVVLLFEGAKSCKSTALFVGQRNRNSFQCSRARETRSVGLTEVSKVFVSLLGLPKRLQRLILTTLSFPLHTDFIPFFSKAQPQSCKPLSYW